jgi:2-polyprenyl-3-methyl-5-hydroxy-6-metoxy-1,4-benzoquinol methylase
MSAELVGKFYDTHANAFMQVYGDVIQAFRTTNVSELLDYQARSMGMEQGMKLLDAGCGVCGPSIHFAKQYGVCIDAITASAEQVRLATEKVEAAGLSGQVTVAQGDYHLLEHYYTAGSYDIVYFLESFGHSHNKALAIAAAWNMLKPGGRLYIKDLFIKEAAIREHEQAIRQNVDRINEAYCYAVGDLYDVLRELRRQGFILSFLKTVDIPLEAFENLTLSNDFQELTGINRIDDLSDYIFPVDFFEILCMKPGYDISRGNNSYFLQNLYSLQVRGIPQEEL